MFSHKHFINVVSALLIILVSSVSFYKFCQTYFYSSISAFLYTAVFTIIFLAAIFYLHKKNFSIKIKYQIVVIVAALMIQVWEIVSRKITDYQSNLWLQIYLSNQHPYNLYGDFALPAFYFILIPFYIIGNTVFADSLGFLILMILIIKSEKDANKNVTLKTIIILLSPLAFYGVFYFSGKTLLAVLLVSFIYMSNNVINTEKYNLTNILVSILFGILISSYIELSVVVIIYFLYIYRNDVRKFFYSVIISSFVFFLTLLPFLFSSNELDSSNNIFSSSIFLNVFPMWSVIILILLICYFGWMIADIQEMFFSIGIILFVIYIIEFIVMGGTGEVTSNFLIAIPFLILSIKNYMVDKFVGKVFG
jgi:hypothetical protein